MDSTENQLIKILQRYLKKENYHIDNNDFKLQLQSNPSFPSVKAITDSLDYFGIENIAANVPKDALDQLPDFFLAVLKIKKTTLIAQIHQKARKIELFKNDGSKENLSISAFKEIWTGTIIVIEKNKTLNNQNFSIFKNPFIPLIILLTYTLTSVILNGNLYAIIYSFSTTIGCVLSYYIIRENMNLHNKFTSKICNSATKNTSCSDVVNSTQGMLLGRFSLSDLSISYFISILCIISFTGFNNSFFKILSLINIPIILYSIYTQAFIIKKWCPLCIGIALILTIKSILILSNPIFFEFDIKYLVTFIVVFNSVFIFWTYLKTLISNSFSLEKLKVEFLKFKRNEYLFDTLLAKETLTHNFHFTDSNSIVFGNTEASLVINAITNPLCGHCTKSFKTYDKLLKTHGNLFRLNIIFNLQSNSLEQESVQIAQRIIELYQGNVNKGYEALNNWFEEKDITIWQKTYGKSIAPADLKIIKHHNYLCAANNINYTPATIINENFYPNEYNIEDLPMFIDHLSEQTNNTVVNRMATI